MTGVDDCPHGMGSPQWCSLCKNANKPHVYITAGGQSYHSTPTCSALKEGQGLVANPAQIQTVALGSSSVEGRKPCRTCRPPTT